MKHYIKLSSDEIKTLIRALCQSQNLLIQETEDFFLTPEYKEEEKLKIKLRATLKGNTLNDN